MSLNRDTFGNFIGRFQPKEIVVQRCEPTVKEVCEPVPKTVCQDKCIDPSTNHQVGLIVIFAGFENCRDEQKRVILEYLLHLRQSETYYQGMHDNPSTGVQGEEETCV